HTDTNWAPPDMYRYAMDIPRIRAPGMMRTVRGAPDTLKRGKTMKTIRKQILIGMTALGLGLGSLTVHAGADVNKDGRAEQRVERMKERMEKGTEELRAKLNLTAEQQPAWDAYIAAMKP